MAREIYAFDMGEFAGFPSDPRLAHHRLDDALTETHPFLATMKEIWSFSYAVVGLYADGKKFDYQVFLHVDNAHDATLVKTFLP